MTPLRASTRTRLSKINALEVPGAPAPPGGLLKELRQIKTISAPMHKPWAKGSRLMDRRPIAKRPEDIARSNMPSYADTLASFSWDAKGEPAKHRDSWRNVFVKRSDA